MMLKKVTFLCFQTSLYLTPTSSRCTYLLITENKEQKEYKTIQIC